MALLQRHIGTIVDGGKQAVNSYQEKSRHREENRLAVVKRKMFMVTTVDEVTERERHLSQQT